MLFASSTSVTNRVRPAVTNACMATVWRDGLGVVTIVARCAEPRMGLPKALLRNSIRQLVLSWLSQTEGTTARVD